jgi:hypothetical protein
MSPVLSLPWSEWLLVGLYLSTLYPWGCAWRANRGTTLRHALVWAGLAWLAWAGVLLAAGCGYEGEELNPFRLLALALTGSAGVAVLGARRPGWYAWDLVVLGLLAVLLLPLAEQLLVGAPALGPVRVLFLLGTGLVGGGNYLPTRLGPAAFLLGLSYGQQLYALCVPGPVGLADQASWLGLGLAPWLGWGCLRRRSGASDLDRVWLAFRDRFGLFWSWRLREQFQRAAARAGWTCTLHWRGLEWGVSCAATPASACPEAPAVRRLLEALTCRFRLPAVALPREPAAAQATVSAKQGRPAD